jgi:hypothetical protein
MAKMALQEQLDQLDLLDHLVVMANLAALALLAMLVCPATMLSTFFAQYLLKMNDAFGITHHILIAKIYITLISGIARAHHARSSSAASAAVSAPKRSQTIEHQQTLNRPLVSYAHYHQMNVDHIASLFYI